MFVTVFVAVSTAIIGVGVLEEVVVPAGTYAYETGTELYQAYVVGTE